MADENASTNTASGSGSPCQGAILPLPASGKTQVAVPTADQIKQNPSEAATYCSDCSAADVTALNSMQTSADAVSDAEATVTNAKAAYAKAVADFNTAVKVARATQVQQYQTANATFLSATGR